MANAHLRRVRSWSRSCDIAISVYRHLPRCTDPQFAERMVQNAFSIPEVLTLAYRCPCAAQQDQALRRGLEAIEVLRTQLYLAAECGMLEAPEVAVLNLEAASLATDLRRQLARIDPEVAAT